MYVCARRYTDKALRRCGEEGGGEELLSGVNKYNDYPLASPPPRPPSAPIHFFFILPPPSFPPSLHHAPFPCTLLFSLPSLSLQHIHLSPLHAPPFFFILYSLHLPPVPHSTTSPPPYHPSLLLYSTPCILPPLTLHDIPSPLLHPPCSTLLLFLFILPPLPFSQFTTFLPLLHLPSFLHRPPLPRPPHNAVEKYSDSWNGIGNLVTLFRER